MQNNLLAANEQKFYENSKRSGPTNSQAKWGAQFIVSSVSHSLFLSRSTLLPLLRCVLCLICSDSVKKLNQQNATATNLFTINYCGTESLIILCKRIRVPPCRTRFEICMCDTKVCFECDFHLWHLIYLWQFICVAPPEIYLCI